MAKPLAGIRVIELANFIAGPLAGTLLADMGADVIKVEPPGGDMSRAAPPIRNGESVSFAALNRNKRSLMLDLKRPEAIEILHKLAAKSDVFLEASRPGALDKLGLGADQIKAINPRIVYTSVSGFGQTGPRAPARRRQSDHRGVLRHPLRHRRARRNADAARRAVGRRVRRHVCRLCDVGRPGGRGAPRRGAYR
jgi:crotonobetainyl-CoA:carnitine CoA-transferase CaiB-like acyl-CoA transferase